MRDDSGQGGRRSSQAVYAADDEGWGHQRPRGRLQVQQPTMQAEQSLPAGANQSDVGTPHP